jgi:hypothetical protein
MLHVQDSNWFNSKTHLLLYSMRLSKIMRRIHNLNKLSTEQFLVKIDQLREDIGLHLLPQQQV